ncbi:flagellar hook-length control protein FliK [Sphingomonas parapaucimobilis]|uniref:flagellar hook-length control protein FliK n=1 Tax=Sphingomonas parapaucimobilis TaxID=28213 RepID=UPI0039EA6A4E
MMPSISSLTPSGTASARLGAGAGAGDPMASAFAMLFALMPGMGDTSGSDSAEGAPRSDGDPAKDGSPTEKDGKDVPSDAAALPVMPFAIPPLSLAPLEPVASPVAASGRSPAPITSLLAAMPTLPDAGSTPTTAPLASAAAPDPSTMPVATGQPITFDPLKGTMPVPTAMTPVAANSPVTFDPLKGTMPVPTAMTPVAANGPVTFDPLKGTMPVPTAMTPVAADDGMPELQVTARPAAPLTMTMTVPGVRVTTPSSASPIVAAARSDPAAPSGTRLDPVATIAGGTLPGTEAVTAQATPVPAIPRDTAPNAPITTQAKASLPIAARDTAQAASVSPVPEATAPSTEQIVRTAAPGIPLAIRGDSSPTVLPIDAAPMAKANDGTPPISPRQDTPLRFAVTNGSAPVVAPLPIQAPAPIIQAGQSAPAIQLFGTAMRGEQSLDPRTDRRKDEPALSVDPATLTRADSLTAAPVVATTGAGQAPLDMTHHHWPQGMIDRIDRMREDAATADTRIQLSPDALGGIAVTLRHEDGTTHIRFTADQAQTASLLADAQPTLARLAEEKGMRLGQTAVDMGQSGMGGDRQAPPRRPDPVVPTRPAFAGATDSSDAGDPAAAPTRIA